MSERNVHKLSRYKPADERAIGITTCTRCKLNLTGLLLDGEPTCVTCLIALQDEGVIAVYDGPAIDAFDADAELHDAELADGIEVQWDG